MADCYDQGALRAYLDAELPAAQHAAIASHLAACAACAADLAQIQATAGQSLRLLSTPTHPDPKLALARVRAIAQPEPITQRRRPMNTSRIRRWLAPAAAVIVAAALLALPPVRAAADQLLQVFRVQTVVFVPVSGERMQQLESLNFDGKSLFLAEPKIVNEPAEPREVASADEAAAAVGFPLSQPADLSASSYTVSDRTIAELQVNVESARELLRLTGVEDVTLPDALGAQPITVNMAPSAVTRYASGALDVQLIQGTAPEVNLPEGVDLSQLGRAALRVLGMAPEQADALSSQIDWSSTLIFPFPADLTTVRQVSVNGAPGLLTTGGGRGQRSAQLYWQRGERFFVLEVEGALGGDELTLSAIQIAESVR